MSRKLDMGKCCIRFKRLEDAALDVIGEAIKRVPLALHLSAYEAALKLQDVQRMARKAAKTSAPPKPTGKVKATTKKSPGKEAAKKKQS